MKIKTPHIAKNSPRDVECPQCGAGKARKCGSVKVTDRAKRNGERFHKARVELAEG